MVILLLMCSIPLDTPQIGWNGKLKEWVVLDGMRSIPLHSIPSIFYKTKQWNVASSHSIPFHPTTLHQPKYSLKVSYYCPFQTPVAHNTIQKTLFYFSFFNSFSFITARKHSKIIRIFFNCIILFFLKNCIFFYTKQTTFI